MDKIVETWLDNNPDWFKSYALRSLDCNTIEDWLKQNKKEFPGIPQEGQQNGVGKSVTCKPALKKYTVKFATSACDYPANTSNAECSAKKASRSKSLSTADHSNNMQDSKFPKRSMVKFKVPSLGISNKSMGNYNANANDEKHMFFIKDDKNDGLNMTGNITADYASNNESKNLISLNMVKRSKLIAMRKYNTMVPDNKHLSLDDILTNTKKKLAMSLAEIEQTADLSLRLTNKKKGNPEFMVELLKDISSELDLKRLSQKIVNNLKLMVDTDEVALFFVSRNSQSVAFKPTIFSYVNDKNSDSEMKAIVETNCFIKQVIETGQLVNIQDVQKEKENNLMLNKVSPQTKSVLCIPIKNAAAQVIAVVQFANNHDSLNEKPKEFTEEDISYLEKYFPSCGSAIAHAQLFDLYVCEYDRNRALLEVVHDLFKQQTNLDTILFRVMQKAQTLLKCQRCSVLLVLDKEDNILEGADGRKAFDLIQNNSNNQRRHSEADDGTKISRNLANYVITTGNTINLSNAYSDPRFDPVVDSVWKFKTQAILCMPIRNLDGEIIGCAQIANRLDQCAFDENDELLFEAFCIFCGLGINNTIIYNQLERSMAEKSVALEVLSYHATCSKNELDSFLVKYQDYNRKIRIENLGSYVFDDFSLDSDEMIIASYDMFKKLGLINIFQIDKKTLFMWLLTVRKNYRNVEYHNWSHAFNVCQSMYSIFQNSKISSYLQDIEKLILLVGCLCHDLDHRGTNNMFQAESQSPLSQLYGISGTLEKHHFNHCIMILNTPGHNIFSNMKPHTYKLVIKYIKEAILATDLAEHFSIRKNFDELVSKKTTDWNDGTSCMMLRKNLMTACDLNAVTKPWNIHQNLVRLVTNEFFAQGDRERFELHIEPQEIMDIRRSHNMPKLQIGWIDTVCLPLYKNISHICDSFKGHLMRIDENRSKWVLLQKRLSKATEIKNRNDS